MVLDKPCYLPNLRPYPQLEGFCFSPATSARVWSATTLKQNAGEKKLARLVTTDVWKAGARNTIEGGGKQLGENKLLTKRKALRAGAQPYSTASSYAAGSSGESSGSQLRKCRICACRCHQVGSYYCQSCAYKKGICAMCGKKLLDTTSYKQSST